MLIKFLGVGSGEGAKPLPQAKKTWTIPIVSQNQTFLRLISTEIYFQCRRTLLATLILHVSLKTHCQHQD